MEDLKNEIANLKMGMDALGVLIHNYTNTSQILALKLEEVHQAIELPNLDIALIENAIEKYFDTHCDFVHDFEFSDGGFSGSFELEVQELLNEEMGRHWRNNLAEAIINEIQNAIK